MNNNNFDVIVMGGGPAGSSVAGMLAREGRSVIPVAFWYCSIGGGIVTLAYTLHLKSVPLSIGQASGLIVYARNLYLIFRERAALRGAAGA